MSEDKKDLKDVKQNVGEDNKKVTNKLDELKKQWKNQYDEVYEIAAENDLEKEDNEPLVFFFKKPGKSNLSRYIKDAMKNAYKAMHNLTFDCLLYPDRDVVSKLIEERPGLIIALGNELQEIIGVNQDFFSKKL